MRAAGNRREHHHRDWVSSHFTRFDALRQRVLFWDGGIGTGLRLRSLFNSYSYDERSMAIRMGPWAGDLKCSGGLQRLDITATQDGLMGPRRAQRSQTSSAIMAWRSLQQLISNAPVARIGLKEAPLV